MNRDDIKKIIPHREPMLLIDYAEKLDDGKAIGKYTVKGDEWFLKGHFPNNPIVPGVILCEMMAQTCCVLLGNSTSSENRTPYFTGLNDVKFREKVTVGDTIELSCNIVRTKGAFFFAEGEATVNDKKAASGKFSFALIENKK